LGSPECWRTRALADHTHDPPPSHCLQERARYEAQAAQVAAQAAPAKAKAAKHKPDTVNQEEGVEEGVEGPAKKAKKVGRLSRPLPLSVGRA
jgi:hypothetical protein